MQCQQLTVPFSPPPVCVGNVCILRVCAQESVHVEAAAWCLVPAEVGLINTAPAARGTRGRWDQWWL